ncbi:unnamed protein product [Pedinophyceae sp. YPF-701]|nr:unnamed protein product [Pedinophyceae sp. YPF-701]
MLRVNLTCHYTIEVEEESDHRAHSRAGSGREDAPAGRNRRGRWEDQRTGGRSSRPAEVHRSRASGSDGAGTSAEFSSTSRFERTDVTEEYAAATGLAGGLFPDDPDIRWATTSSPRDARARGGARPQRDARESFEDSRQLSVPRDDQAVCTAILPYGVDPVDWDVGLRHRLSSESMDVANEGSMSGRDTPGALSPAATSTARRGDGSARSVRGDSQGPTHTHIHGEVVLGQPRIVYRSRGAAQQEGSPAAAAAAAAAAAIAQASGSSQRAVIEAAARAAAAAVARVQQGPAQTGAESPASSRQSTPRPRAVPRAAARARTPEAALEVRATSAGSLAADRAGDAPETPDQSLGGTPGARRHFPTPGRLTESRLARSLAPLCSEASNEQLAPAGTPKTVSPSGEKSSATVAPAVPGRSPLTKPRPSIRPPRRTGREEACMFVLSRAERDEMHRAAARQALAAHIDSSDSEATTPGASREQSREDMSGLQRALSAAGRGLQPLQAGVLARSQRRLRVGRDLGLDLTELPKGQQPARTLEPIASVGNVGGAAALVGGAESPGEDDESSAGDVAVTPNAHWGDPMLASVMDKLLPSQMEHRREEPVAGVRPVAEILLFGEEDGEGENGAGRLVPGAGLPSGNPTPLLADLDTAEVRRRSERHAAEPAHGSWDAWADARTGRRAGPSTRQVQHQGGASGHKGELGRMHGPNARSRSSTMLTGRLASKASELPSGHSHADAGSRVRGAARVGLPQLQARRAEGAGEDSTEASMRDRPGPRRHLSHGHAGLGARVQQRHSGRLQHVAEVHGGRVAPRNFRAAPSAGPSLSGPSLAGVLGVSSLQGSERR